MDSAYPTQPAQPSRKWVIIFILVVIALLAAAVWYFLTPTGSEKLSEIRQIYLENTLLTDRRGRLDALENAAQLSEFGKEGAAVKIKLADALSEIDRTRSVEILKEVAANEKYEPEDRAFALNILGDFIELDFIERDFLKQKVFTGDVFGKMLANASWDEQTAVRLMQEWSQELSPNVIASYRIAKWYAEQLYKKRNLSEAEKSLYKQSVKEYLAIGDELFEQSKAGMHPARRGIVYETKARTIRMAGEEPNKVRGYYQLAVEAYLEQPQTLFQIVHLNMARLYRSAFLAETYGEQEALSIQKNYRGTLEYLKAPQPPERRNVRLVSFLIAARDSNEPFYPAPDFSRKDIERIGALYPDFKATVESLNLLEYVKGHPLEEEIKSL